jgi:peptidoglycan/LPS O-acetylase OafA/YrhL
MPHFTWTWFVVTWSLAIEEQFYLLAPPLIRFLSIRRFVVALAATIIIAPLLRFLLFRYWAPGAYLCSYLMPCRADSLSCGMLLAVAWRDARFREFLRTHAALLQRVLLVLFLGVGGLLWWLVHPINAVTVTIGYPRTVRRVPRRQHPPHRASRRVRALPAENLLHLQRPIRSRRRWPGSRLR